MSQNENYNSQTPGQNAFLSRIFGLQSGDVTHSIQDEEMNMYPLTGDIPIGSTSSGRPHLSDEEQRIPESDQESSSQDEDNAKYESSSIAEPTDMSDVNLASSYLPNHDNINASTRVESIQKIGQLSSDEEVSENSRAFDNESADEDMPLFNIPKDEQSNKKISQLEDNKDQNTLDTLNTNHTSVNDTNKGIPFSYKVSSKSDKRSRFKPSIFQMKSKKNGVNMMKSFLVDDNDRKKRNTTRRPTIFPNISMLNKKSLYRVDNLSPTEAALWKWANVENLDVFLQDVYNYYLENGFTCIFLQKILNLLTLLFVVWVSTYLGYCIDYNGLSGSQKLSDVIVSQCYKTRITGFVKFLLWIFYGFVVLKVFQLYFDFKKLKEMRNFYTYLLDISDDELQTIPWQSVIKQLVFLKDQNALTANVVEVKAKNRIDAHEVANRIMRKENYLIALFNSDVLNFSLPYLPFDTGALTKTLEWNINLCVIGFAFNDAGFIKQGFLKPSQRDYMVEELQKRFMLAGFLNILLSPFLVAYFVLLYFFRYFNEYKNSPGSMGTRQYTPMAEWKFREYNELYHLFKKRLGLSRKLSNKYVEQFPREKTNIIMKFIAFISGSFAAILALLTIFDSENFLNFEITKDRTVIFYITILGTIWSVSNSAVSNEYNVFDPEETLMELAQYTHYNPDDWKDRYHTEYVKQEFCNLYSLRILILLGELTSMILTPFILWFALPQSAEKIVDFFRESSVYIDGLGYVSKYAMFGVQGRDNIDFQTKSTKFKGQNLGKGDISNSLHSLSDEDEVNAPALNKMMQSYMYFIDDYENVENITGKYQLPNKRVGKNIPKNIPNDDYSWKKQFKPGQNPELFTISRNTHPLGTQQSRKFAKMRDNSDTIDSTLDSFIIPGNPNDQNNNVEMDKSTGVFKLVKDYYKKSDIGR
ncbi:similar to Saccharomyces cerevisiae YDL149W ATG9 Transmembrane protein involved in forming Cvt and autophagic vesicles [Maudiozyma barnettii]|uniref:Autophagy-related protein 9 n=1 Tax=Maudiozyma barnettii TaxID=61262 RepID=A0A8H2VBG6_9SACH|nr:autophagy protein ATG9 [Kazachstania barnettii]CAB4252202.1 similar to Saccharomyces cerevisiae YDL149W ATG9 Transmembrane protein involved in forming Cvt and autophagic vesicles [Kazachstania barnettii]CAD1778823.1 similar to Saccharomyces cerevisiae YDL149W ATG9 Transmembrane protein involved in forming Cvt and autophagic vesicles [Kazachstania barnettii]